MLVPIDSRTDASELPTTIDLFIPMLYACVSMSFFFYHRVVQVCIALMGGTNLMMTHDFRFRNSLVFRSSHQMLGTDKRVAEELGRSDHFNELFRWHFGDAVMANDAVVDLEKA